MKKPHDYLYANNRLESRFYEKNSGSSNTLAITITY